MPAPHRRPSSLFAVWSTVFLLTVSIAAADVVLLKDGRRFEGTVKKQTAQELVFETRFGEMTFAMSDVSSVEKGKTPSQEFDERWKKCAKAKEFFELGTWADGKKLKSHAKKAMKQARKLNPRHEGANLYLGFVLHKGQWMTPEERDEALLLEEAAEMRKRGLVRHAEQWVTIEDKEKLDAGLVQHAGRWITPEELKRLEGFALLNGEWVRAVLVQAVEHGDKVLGLASASGRSVVGVHAAVTGPFDAEFLDPIVHQLDAGRAYFDEQFSCAPGEELLGGRLAEFYVWGREDEQYLSTVDYLVSLTDRVPPNWGDAVKGTHGFVYWHPFCVSSARTWGRPQDDLGGHCYHHFGHILVNRHRYTGRLLPPWFDEGFASLFEFRVHGRNAVFCIANPATVTSSGPTSARKVEYVFDTKKFRRGTWQETLRKALETEQLRAVTFDKLAQKQFGELSLLDIAMSMGVVSWLESRGEGALDRFQDVLQSTAPDPPMRVRVKGAERQGRYDEAFQAAVKMNWREADKAWRTWFLETEH